MIKEDNYIFKFDESGCVFQTNAPFFNFEDDYIATYLPIFSDLSGVESLIGKEIFSYETTIAERTYFLDLFFLKHQGKSATIYELSIFDRTKLYERFQKERSEKNKLRISKSALQKENVFLRKVLEGFRELHSHDKATMLINELEDIQKVVLSHDGDVMEVNSFKDEVSSRVSQLVVKNQRYQKFVKELLKHTQFRHQHFFLSSLLDRHLINLNLGPNFTIENLIPRESRVFLNKGTLFSVLDPLFNYFSEESPARATKLSVSISESSEKDLVIQFVSLNGWRTDNQYIDLKECFSGNLQRITASNELWMSLMLIKFYGGEYSFKKLSSSKSTILLTFKDALLRP